jgi:proton-dependent oligopeptide transporter, POT family
MNKGIPAVKVISLSLVDIEEHPVPMAPPKWKHPKELFHVSFYTMWVNFSFYGMKALLITYIVTQMRLGEHRGYAILGTYSALVYGLPFLGGMVADKFLGTRKSIIWGSILQIAGHLTLAIPFHQTFFFAGLAFVACGSGFGFGTDNALVGSLYDNKDTRKKDEGFTIFYMIFNVGAALGGLMCGYVGEKINWHYGFGMAGFFMILGLLNFLYGIDSSHGAPPDKPKLKENVFFNISCETAIYIITLVVIGLVTLLFYSTGIMDAVMLPLTLAAFVYIIIISFRFTKGERWKLFAALLLLLFTSFFWTFYEQQGGSLNLFVIHNVNTHFAGVILSGLAVNNFFPGFWLVVLTPVFILFWKKLYKNNIEPRPPLKFVFAFLLMALFWSILWLGCHLNHATGQVPIIFLVVGYFIVECAELSLGPVSYSLASKLSPQAIASTMMGMLFLATSLGEYLAGKLGAIMTVPTNITSPIESLPYYSSIFLRIAIACSFIALSLFALNPLLKKWMQEIR